jgi:hypothetical protein
MPAGSELSWCSRTASVGIAVVAKGSILWWRPKSRSDPVASRACRLVCLAVLDLPDVDEASVG